MTIEAQLERIANSLEHIARCVNMPVDGEITSDEVIRSLEEVVVAQKAVAEKKTRAPRTPKAAPAEVPAAATPIANMFDAPAAQTTLPDMTMAECNQELAQLAQSGVNTAAIMEIVQSYAPTGLRDVNPSKFREVVEKAKALKKV